MLPYRTESPVLPARCPVRGGRVVHGPQFAYCPSPQGRCPQPFSSSPPQLCFWPDPGPGSAGLCSAGRSLPGQDCNTAAVSPQPCTGCQVPTAAPSRSAPCPALSTASPAPAPRGACARAASATSWMRSPGRGTGWAWTSCRGQVRPQRGGGLTAPGLGNTQRSDRGTWGTWGARTVGCQVGRGVLMERPSVSWGDMERAEGQWGSWHKALQGGRRWRGPWDRWHSWGHEPWAARSNQSGIRL